MFIVFFVNTSTWNILKLKLKLKMLTNRSIHADNTPFDPLGLCINLLQMYVTCTITKNKTRRWYTCAETCLKQQPHLLELA
jgi:hypothetical protein